MNEWMTSMTEQCCLPGQRRRTREALKPWDAAGELRPVSASCRDNEKPSSASFRRCSTHLEPPSAHIHNIRPRKNIRGRGPDTSSFGRQQRLSLGKIWGGLCPLTPTYNRHWLGGLRYVTVSFYNKNNHGNNNAKPKTEIRLNLTPYNLILNYP